MKTGLILPKFNTRILVFFILPLCLLNAQAQNKVNILSSEPVSNILTDKVKTQFGITYPIFRVYQYDDKSGKNLIVLTESFDGVNSTNDTLHYNIKAFGFTQNQATELLKNWEIRDFKIKQEYTSESSIWFWTKYCAFEDADKDGFIDPILVYGTSGSNGFDDGRIKIFILYKKQKIGIRQQNGTLDFERNTQVDKAFYTLPVAIQAKVKRIIEKIIADDRAIFPYGWQDAMKKQKTFFDERTK